MSGAWEFIKRHKGKIIALGALTGAAAGSAYAYYTQQEAQQHLLSSLSENEFRFQPRRHFVFNAQQRACDKSIRDIVPNLSSLIEDRFPIEQLTEKLKQNSDMSVEEKVEIWEKIKVLSVARIMGVAYSYSLLTLALKSQISILAADICTEFERTICYTPTWLDTIKTQVENLLGYEAEPIRDPYIEVNSKQVASNRQVFIRCIEYLTTTGVAKLLTVIEETCKEFCSSISLTDRVNQDSLRDVLDQIDGKLSELEPCFFSKLVAPLSEEERVSDDGVLQLLTRLVKALESKECRETLVSLVDFYLTAAVHKAPEKPEVLAKLLPSMSDVYYFISTDGYDSPLQNSLCSSDVDNFAGFVFGLTKQPALSSALIAQYK